MIKRRIFIRFIRSNYMDHKDCYRILVAAYRCVVILEARFANRCLERFWFLVGFRFGNSNLLFNYNLKQLYAKPTALIIGQYSQNTYNDYGEQDRPAVAWPGEKKPVEDITKGVVTGDSHGNNSFQITSPSPRCEFFRYCKTRINCIFKYYFFFLDYYVKQIQCLRHFRGIF